MMHARRRARDYERLIHHSEFSEPDRASWGPACGATSWAGHDAAMSVQHPQEVGQGHVVARYVAGERRYIELLGGGFLHFGEEERTSFAASLQADSLQARDQEIGALFGYEWRARLTAG